MFTSVQGDHFTAKDIAFENYAGAEKHQAVALRVSADLVLFHNCRMDGYQDTLYAHTYRQFYSNCTITGTIDFVFGDSAAIFQDCTFVVRKPLPNQSCIVTAQGRKDIRQPTGLVLQNCSFVADHDYFPLRHTNKAYLGRPWKEFSRTIILESFLDDLIQPQGWLPWNETFALDTLFYTEFNNRGPAASKAGRVTWAGVKELPASRIRRFTADKFIDGKRWVPVQGVPYAGGFMLPVPAKDANAGAYSPVVPEEDKDIGGSKDKSDSRQRLQCAAEYDLHLQSAQQRACVTSLSRLCPAASGNAKDRDSGASTNPSTRVASNCGPVHLAETSRV
ncbi:Probable pectinesterase/pectinesterase inhibitor 58 [Striga hermonthica]|uniref:Pectinesterase n=1 Tax=Striga hermonthica TaxID=68872 RepID=A0A9N7R9Y6_STRHE|nr:Probable pectinesterase/pectinesterase inhibitor 58 [Striga hermonthica]